MSKRFPLIEGSVLVVSWVDESGTSLLGQAATFADAEQIAAADLAKGLNPTGSDADASASLRWRDIGSGEFQGTYAPFVAIDYGYYLIQTV